MTKKLENSSTENQNSKVQLAKFLEQLSLDLGGDTELQYYMRRGTAFYFRGLNNHHGFVLYTSPEHASQLSAQLTKNETFTILPKPILQ